ncbi:uncharacterized protein OCT59_011288 [Rhizophagus irregularis]|nr:hypothetical protein OCT59_011288 [Rhizophagus irregularis]
MKEKHNFREFFYLCTPDNPKANKKAVCFSCIRKHTLPIAISKPECFVSNKALLCRNHLKKCENFAHEYHESEREEILSRKVPEDEKKNKTQAIINESEMETDKSTTAAPSNSIIKQSTLSGYVSRPFSKKDIPHFENLVLLMMVSNGLSFTFLENKETQEVFRFIAPALKLPGRHAISNRILSKSANQLSISIVEQAKGDAIGVTAAFDGWTNVKQEHLFGVVLITSSAGEYAAARRQLRVEYPKAALKTLITKCSPERIGTPSTSRAGHKKVLAMAQLRSDILCKRKRDDIEISERQYKRLHIAEPIQEYQSDEEDTNDNEFTFNAFNDSDTEELEETSVIDECNVNDTFEKTNNSDNINSEQWTKIIEDWIKMVNAEININNTEVIGEETYEFKIGGQSIHPADNPLAKWKLLDLFNETLEAPVNMF